MIHPSLPLAAPLLFALVTVLACFMPGRRPRLLLFLAEASALGAIALAIARVCQLLEAGSATAPVLGLGGIDLSIRLDAVSVTMLAMITTIGWAVLRYSANYLDGEARQGAFIGWMAATLANVLLFVLAGNLVHLVAAWIATSLCLHRLLLFYPERLQAIRGARKKFIVARISDAALAGAAVLLWQGYGMIDLATILAEARGGAAPLGPHAIAGEGPGESVVVEHDIKDLMDAVLGAGVVETDECLDPPVEVAAHQVGRPDVGRRLTRAVAVREVVNA